MTEQPGASKKPQETQRESATHIVRRLQEAGHPAYFAGGCVRDILLAKHLATVGSGGCSSSGHVGDFDVATSASTDEIRGVFPFAKEVGAAFGVLMVRRHGHSVEVSTFRADGPYSDRRHPDSVTKGTIEQDARRRDFTINGLYFDPVADPEACAPIDLVGGVADLQEGIVRAISASGSEDARHAANARIDEDHLRMLRAVRFAARLGFKLEAATEAAIMDHAPQLTGVSRERIGIELRRMLTHDSRVKAIAMIEQLGLDAPTLGEAARERGSVCGFAHLGSLRGAVAVGTALAAWWLDRSSSDRCSSGRCSIDRWTDALVLSNAESTALHEVVGLVHSLCDSTHPWESLPLAARRRMAMAEGFGDATRLVAVTQPVMAEAIAKDLRHFEAIGLRPQPVLNGADLIELGARPGPRFKVILDAVYDAQLEGRVGDTALGIAMAKTLIHGADPV